MAKRNEAEIRAKLGEEKFNFMQRFNEIIKHPSKHLFTDGKFDPAKLSALYNEFADLYLKGDLKGKLPDSKFPKISVQKLTMLPPGSKNSKTSGGNYNRQYNFVEINAEHYYGKGDKVLAALIIKELATVCHEYQHFKQNLYATGKIQDSKIPTGDFNAAEVEENNKTMIELTPEQLEIAKGMLGENPEEIKADFLYGDQKNRLIDISRSIAPSAYAAGEKKARGSKILGIIKNPLKILYTNGKEPLYAAHYLLRPYEIDARDTSIAHFDTFIRDFQTFSHGKSRDISTALKVMSNLQKAANWWDKHKQPKEAMEVFMEEARKTISPEIIVEYLSSEQFETVAGERKPLPQDKKEMIVIRSVTVLIESFSPEKQSDFLKRLEGVSKEVVEQIKANIAEKNQSASTSTKTYVTSAEIDNERSKYPESQQESQYGKVETRTHEETSERDKTPDELALEEMQMGPRPHYDD